MCVGVLWRPTTRGERGGETRTRGRGWDAGARSEESDAILVARGDADARASGRFAPAMQ
jgi:hypothetical protein